jgi:hypothetical protein
MHNLPIRRLLAAVLLLAALAGGSVGCGAEGGIAPEQHGSQTYRFVAEGTPRRAHVFLKVGSFVHVDDARNLPWETRQTVAPHQFVVFTVMLIDYNPRDSVSCKILNAAGETQDEDGPKVWAQCGLVPYGQPA